MYHCVHRNSVKLISLCCRKCSVCSQRGCLVLTVPQRLISMSASPQPCRVFPPFPPYSCDVPACECTAEATWSVKKKMRWAPSFVKLQTVEHDHRHHTKRLSSHAAANDSQEKVQIGAFLYTITCPISNLEWQEKGWICSDDSKLQTNEALDQNMTIFSQVTVRDNGQPLIYDCVSAAEINKSPPSLFEEIC